MSKRKFMILLVIPLIFAMFLSAWSSRRMKQHLLLIRTARNCPPTGPEETPVDEETPTMNLLWKKHPMEDPTEPIETHR
jgi:hypothetical protein